MGPIAFLGLGTMGRGMAARLIAAKRPVTLWSRTPTRAHTLAAEAGRADVRVAASAREAAEGAEVIISMVADDGASRSVWLEASGALGAARPGSVLIESSTVSPAWIAELSAQASARGVAFLDAPVTGSKTQAETGQLLFLVGGPADVLARVQPVLAHMSRGHLHVGPSGSGARLKLINNFLCGVQAVALAEGVALIERAGLNRDLAMTMLADGAPGSPLVKAMGPRMTGVDGTVHFSLDLMRKDLAYAVAEADHWGLDLATATAALGRFTEASMAGFGHRDFSSVIEAPRNEGQRAAGTAES